MLQLGRVPAAILVCAIAGAVVAIQPLAEPWWVNADPDGAYAASALNLLVGNHTVYLDHPGFANQQALALLFGGAYAVERLTGHGAGLRAFADHQLLHLDEARPLYRGFAIAVFLLAALAAFLAVSRLLGPGWGLAAGVLFAAAPAVGPIAIMLRPDVAAAACAIVVACLTAAAFERRSAGLYLSAAFLLGVALTTKLVVVGLVPALLLAALWRGPSPGWLEETAAVLRGRLLRRRGAVGISLACWVALCVFFNWSRPRPVLTIEARHLLIGVVAAIAIYAVVALAAARLRVPVVRLLFRPFVALGASALVAGFALPASFALDDAPAMALSVWQTATGRGLNESVRPFADFDPHALLHYPLLGTTIVVACAVAAAAVGIGRRVYWPLVLALASVLLAVEAAARLNVPYYYASAYAVAIPGTLWLLSLVRRPLGALLGTALALYLVVGALTNPGSDPAPQLQWNRDAQAVADRVLRGHELILTPYWSTWPIEDLRYDGLVVQYAEQAPTWPYRFVEGGSPRLEGDLVARVAYYATSRSEAQSLLEAGSVVVGDRRYMLAGEPIPWGGTLDRALVRVTGEVADG